MINLTYWGDGHRAFVTSMSREEFPWSLVTFYDTQMLDTVNVEWFITAVALTLIYCSVYILIGVGTILMRPTYRAPWAWPDGIHSSGYLRLFSTFVLFAVAWLAALLFVDPPERLWIVCVLPLLAWVLTFVTLQRSTGPTPRVSFSAWVVVIAGLWLTLAWGIFARDLLVWRVLFIGLIGLACARHLLSFRRGAGSGSHKMAPPLSLSYGLASGSLLVVTAVLPAFTFFTIAHNVDVGTFVRHAQLMFSQDLAERERTLPEPGDRGPQPAGAVRLAPCRNSMPDSWTSPAIRASTATSSSARGGSATRRRATRQANRPAGARREPMRSRCRKSSRKCCPTTPKRR